MIKSYVGERTVSRETLDRLKTLESLIKRWTTKINLIAPSTIPDIWNRHIVDSAQVYYHANKRGKWVDIGSGAGLPGLVIAILNEEDNKAGTVTLVESDLRKSTFLKTAARELGIGCEVINARIETIKSQQADIITARALAPLPKLLEHTSRHLAPSGITLFPKGAKRQIEVQAARKIWSFEQEEFTSWTDRNDAILRLSRI